MVPISPSDFEALNRYLADREAEFDQIPEDRKAELNAIADFVRTVDRNARLAGEAGDAKLTFICTHNSRRSHLCQVWAQVAAHFVGIDSLVTTYSGGTETTAFYASAVNALRRAGLDVQPVEVGANTKYAVTYAEGRGPLVCFSKKYNDATVNPTTGYAAVMTCGNADRACPLVRGLRNNRQILLQNRSKSSKVASKSQIFCEN